MRNTVDLGTLTIASSGTTSLPLDGATSTLNLAFNLLVDLIIYAPSALTGTVTMQVSPVQSPSSGDWKTLYIGGTAVTLVAGSATVVPMAGARAIRVVSGSAEGASRAFVLVGQIDT